MSNLSQFFGSGGGIKSIQRLTVSQTSSGNSLVWPSTVTISSVDVNKTIILVNGQPGFYRSSGQGIRSISSPSVNLTSSTSISLSGITAIPDSLATAGVINIQVVEFS